MNELTDILREVAVDAYHVNKKPMTLQTGIYQGGDVQLNSQLIVTPSEQDSIKIKIENLELNNVEVSGTLNGEAVSGTLNLKTQDGTIKFKRIFEDGDAVQVLKHDGQHKYRIII